MVEKANKGINVGKNSNRFKKLKVKIKKREKEKKKKRQTPQNCKSPTQRQRFITTIKNVTKETQKTKLKRLIRSHSADKIDRRWAGVGNEQKEKKYKRIYRTGQTIRIINVFLESLLSESFPSLGVTVHLTSLGCPPTLC